MVGTCAGSSKGDADKQVTAALQEFIEKFFHCEKMHRAPFTKVSACLQVNNEKKGHH